MITIAHHPETVMEYPYTRYFSDHLHDQYAIVFDATGIGIGDVIQIGEKWLLGRREIRLVRVL